MVANNLEQVKDLPAGKWIAIYWNDPVNISSYPTIGVLEKVDATGVATYIQVSGTEYEFTDQDFPKTSIATLKDFTFTPETN
jgi:hypothetical protein